jgi:hypothetical protein
MKLNKTLIAACACALAASASTAVASFDRGSKHKSHHSSSDRCNTRGHDLVIAGITQDSKLICFQDDSPNRAKTIGSITGLATDTKLLGIDYRPATGSDGDHGDLYGLGDQGGIYVINQTTAAATLKSRLDVALSGQSFGVDFNPTVDRLRVVSDTGQNLRINVDTGATLTDTALTYPPTAASATGAAYTNNDSDPNTATTLFDIDPALDQVALQSPANSGQLAATGKLTVDTSSVVGSDIYSTVRNGTTVGTEAYASLTVGGVSGLYRIDLLQGKANARGLFSSSNAVTGIAIPLNQK